MFLDKLSNSYHSGDSTAHDKTQDNFNIKVLIDLWKNKLLNFKLL